MLKRVLIPLDGSDLAEQILEPALELDCLMQAEFTLLRVVEPIVVADYQWGGNALNSVDRSLMGELQAQAEDYLNRVAARVRGRCGGVQTRVITNRYASAAILEEAQGHAMNLIALQTHARGGLARLLLGSVADKVLRAATTPVLVRRPLGKG
jgi:nucleotide-binding universal stress UspA family protein